MAAVGAALGLVVVTSALPAPDGQSFTFEAFALLPMVGAVALADHRRYGWAGVALAAAALTKQTALVAAAPVMWSAWRSARPRRPAFLRLLAGVVLPVVATAATLGWGPFWFWVATGNSGYLRPEAFGHQLGLGVDRVGDWLLAVAPLAALAVGAVVVGAKPSRFGVAEPAPRLGSALVWLAASVPAVCAGWRFFPHYLVQAGPPLALLAAIGLALAGPRLRVAAVGLTAGLALWSVSNATEPPPMRPADPVVAAIERHSDPGEPIFVWGMYPTAYWASDRPPATRFLNVGFLTNVSGGVLDGGQVAEHRAVPGTWGDFDADLQADPPAVVVDTTHRTAIAIGRFPRFQVWLEANYDKVETVALADIWVLKGAA